MRHGSVLPVIVAGSLVLAGCAGTGNRATPSPSATPSSSATASSTATPSPSGTTPAARPADVVALLPTVDWPDDAVTIQQVFAALPEQLAGQDVVGRYPDPETLEPQEGDGRSVTYGSAGGPTTLVGVSPSEGIVNPTQGIASSLIYAGGPKRCVDASHAPIFTTLFTLDERDALFAEMDRIAAIAAGRGQLVWVVCTQTYGGEPATALPPSDWVSLADWADGGWTYSIHASSPQMRLAAVQALVDAVRTLEKG